MRRSSLLSCPLGLQHVPGSTISKNSCAACPAGKYKAGTIIIQPNLSQDRHNNLPREHGVDGRIHNEVLSASLFLYLSISLSASVPSLL